MKRKGTCSLDIKIDATRPETTVITHKLFPKRDMCNDLEYSLFVEKRESMT
jgi:hypothetical protein